MSRTQPFPQDEFEQRIARIQARMNDAEFDALLLTAEHDVRYVSGYLTRFWESPTRPWFIVVPLSGKPVAVIPSIGTALMGDTWIEDIRTWPAPRPEDDGVTLLADTLKELVPPSGKIGLAMGHEWHLRMPLSDFYRLEELITPRAFADATDVLRRLQAIKSEKELAVISEVCGVADRAFGRMNEIVSIGKPLRAVYRDFQIALLAEGADWVPYVAGGAGPGGYADVISPATDEPLRDGDLLMLDTGAVRHGYFCDFDRNWAIGSATQAMRDGYRLLYEATDAGFAAAVPGARAADVFHAMQAVIERGGDSGAGGRLGHGLGMRLTEYPSLTASDMTFLEPGMVLTLEPGLELSPGRIMVHEENIVIEKKGPRYLTKRAPEELPVLEAQS